MIKNIIVIKPNLKTKNMKQFLNFWLLLVVASIIFGCSIGAGIFLWWPACALSLLSIPLIDFGRDMLKRIDPITWTMVIILAITGIASAVIVFLAVGPVNDNIYRGMAGISFLILSVLSIYFAGKLFGKIK